MKTEEFNFDLPSELIAQSPAVPRDSSRLLFLDRGKQILSDHIFSDLSRLIPRDSVIVFNQSKVIPARLLFPFHNRDLEIFFVRPLEENVWLCMTRPSKYFPLGAEYDLFDGWHAVVQEVKDDGMRVFSFSHSSQHVLDLLYAHGKTPFPPYIKNVYADSESYQTVYAKSEGSVAAPTAGLHFTERLLSELNSIGIQMEFVTLHVGPGTFVPVKSEHIEEHRMHEEFFEIDEATCTRLNEAKRLGKKIIAVGTTSNRVLESACRDTILEPGAGMTHLFIYPGYTWKFVDGLITNFHLPKSTLLMLVSAFADREFVLKAYYHAIEKRYRFFSFGDAMLIL